jgi:hypothetical protein
VLQDFSTEEQRSGMCFLWKNDSMHRIFTNKYFLFMVRSVCPVKLFIAGAKSIADNKEVETEMRQWLCVNVGEGYVE